MAHQGRQNNNDGVCPKCKVGTNHVPGVGYICPKCLSCYDGPPQMESPEPSIKPDLRLVPKPEPETGNNPDAHEDSVLRFARPRGEDMRQGSYTLKFAEVRWTVYGKKFIALFHVTKGKYRGYEVMYPLKPPPSGKTILSGSNLHLLARLAAKAQGIGLQDLRLDLKHDDLGDWLKELCRGLTFTAKVGKVTRNWKGYEKKRPYARIKTLVRATKTKD